MGSFSRITVLRVFSRSALGKPNPSVMPRWNRLSWRDDRAVLLRSGRPGLAMQVEAKRHAYDPDDSAGGGSLGPPNHDRPGGTRLGLQRDRGKKPGAASRTFGRRTFFGQR